MAILTDEIVVRVTGVDETPALNADDMLPAGRTTIISIAQLRTLLGSFSSNTDRFTMAGNHTADLSAADPVKFDQSERSLFAITSLGRITIPAGGEFLISAACRATGAGAVEISYQWFDVTGVVSVGNIMNALSPTDASDDTGGGFPATAIIDTSAGARDVELRIGANTGATAILADSSYLLVQQLTG